MREIKIKLNRWNRFGVNGAREAKVLIMPDNHLGVNVLYNYLFALIPRLRIYLLIFPSRYRSRSIARHFHFVRMKGDRDRMIFPMVFRARYWVTTKYPISFSDTTQSHVRFVIE